MAKFNLTHFPALNILMSKIFAYQAAEKWSADDSTLLMAHQSHKHDANGTEATLTLSPVTTKSRT